MQDVEIVRFVTRERATAGNRARECATVAVRRWLYGGYVHGGGELSLPYCSVAPLREHWRERES